MRQWRCIFFITFFLLIHLPALIPCTLVSVQSDGMILVGNNEDASPSYPCRAIFRQATKDHFGYVIFAFADGWPQGGMNDQGLLFGGVAGYSTDWTDSTDKLDYWDNLSLKIMTECATVDEALAVFEMYNNPDLVYSRTMFADKHGESVIVWLDGTMQVTRRQKSFQVLGYGEHQALKQLRKSQNYSVEFMQNIMSDCMQYRRDVVTLYSLVYDLKSCEIHVFNVYQGRGLLHPRRIKKRVTLNLYDELSKGDHYYDLLHLASQVKEAPQTDPTTLYYLKPDSRALSTIQGAYQSKSGAEVVIRIDNDRLLMSHSSLPGRTFLLYSASDRMFFTRVFNFTVELPSDLSQPAPTVTLGWTNREGINRCEQGMRKDRLLAGSKTGA